MKKMIETKCPHCGREMYPEKLGDPLNGWYQALLDDKETGTFTSLFFCPTCRKESQTKSSMKITINLSLIEA